MANGYALTLLSLYVFGLIIIALKYENNKLKNFIAETNNYKDYKNWVMRKKYQQDNARFRI